MQDYKPHEHASPTAGFNGDLPLEQASTLPATHYLNPDIYQQELARVFRQSWQYVGPVSRLRESGDFFTETIAGEPILLVRDKENKVRAFANVCRHRAARVECRSHGKAKGFRCRYHGWAYNLSGQLAGAPDFEGVENFETSTIRLPEFAVAEAGPFLFVHLDPPQKPWSQAFAPLSERFGEYGLEAMTFHSRQEYTLQCNWKLFVDNYLDGGYHIGTVHPNLAKVVDYGGYHNVLHEQTNVQVSPLKQASGQDNQDLNQTRRGDQAYYWWAYPNFMLNAYEGVMDINIVYPLAVDRCRVVFEYYFNDQEFSATDIDKSIAVAHEIQLEDIEICEEVQKGLGSHSYHNGRFSLKRESTGYHFHQLIAAHLQNPNP